MATDSSTTQTGWAWLSDDKQSEISLPHECDAAKDEEEAAEIAERVLGSFHPGTVYRAVTDDGWKTWRRA